MPRFLEKKLKKEYGAKSDIPYRVMNAEGYMHGSKETPKGAALEEKHEEDQRKRPKPEGRRAHGFNWRNRHGLRKVG